MLSVTIYCKDHKRMPVRFGFAPFLRDPQADIPLAWCICCGSEVFTPGQERCIRCRSTKGEKR